MELDLDTGRLVVFVAGFLLFFGIETLFPARPWRGARYRRLGFHTGIAVLNTVLIRVVAYVPFLLWTVYVEEQGWGISRWLGLVGWTEIVLSIVVLDCFDYLWHRANHRVRFLWRFHKAHHADTAMDVTTALRFHPGELLISALVKALWVLAWGPTVVAWFLFEALVSLCAQFHHSNIDFADVIERWLSRIIVTPRYHAAHHAVDRRFATANYATILSVWDRLFRSYARPADGGATTRASDALGLPEARELAFSPVAWLDEPFRVRNLDPDRAYAMAPAREPTEASWRRQGSP
jgi:sterol desaturase/sphingolipid hydroxylase (fatty acid hydroxylase superfamily)